jgi:hypothetical protein
MRTGLLLSLILILAPLGVRTQLRDEVTLTGSVNGVTASVDSSTGEDAFLFNIRLYLQIRNNGNETIFIFRPGGSLSQRKVEFFKSEPADANVRPEASQIVSWINASAKDGYNPFADFATRIERAKEPPDSVFAVIEPGGYFETGDSITVNVGYKPDMERVEARKKYFAERGLRTHFIDIGQPSSGFPFLSVEYFISFKKHHQDADFLHATQRRWRKFGKLYLNSSGDFLLRSEPIVNLTGPVN